MRRQRCLGSPYSEHDILARRRLGQAASLYGSARKEMNEGNCELAFRLWGHALTHLVEAGTHAQAEGWPDLEAKLDALASVSRRMFDKLLGTCLRGK